MFFRFGVLVFGAVLFAFVGCDREDGVIGDSNGMTKEEYRQKVADAYGSNAGDPTLAPSDAD